MQLKVLSAGAAQGVVTRLGERFQNDTECEIDGVFSGVVKIRRSCSPAHPPT